MEQEWQDQRVVETHADITHSMYNWDLMAGFDNPIGEHQPLHTHTDLHYKPPLLS